MLSLRAPQLPGQWLVVTCLFWCKSSCTPPIAVSVTSSLHDGLSVTLSEREADPNIRTRVPSLLRKDTEPQPGLQEKVVKRHQQHSEYAALVDVADAAPLTGEENLAVKAATEQDDGNIRFVPKVRTCTPPASPAPSRGLDAILSLLAVKHVLDELGIPAILLNDLLLGWRQYCAPVHDDPEVTLGTFGPWIASVGLRRLKASFDAQGHVLSTSMCKGGLLQSGCRLRVLLKGIRVQSVLKQLGFPFVDITVFFSPPALAFSGGRPIFSECNVDSCGSGCEACRIATTYKERISKSEDHFFPCPVPLKDFELVAWMNETFWVPANLDGYLKAEYGKFSMSDGSWPMMSQTPQPHRSCSESLAKRYLLSSYSSSFPGLPPMKSVSLTQRAVEKARQHDISASSIPQIEFLNMLHEKPSLEKVTTGVFDANPTNVLTTVLLVTNSLLILVGISTVAKWMMHNDNLWQNGYLGVSSRLQAVLFFTYAGLSCAHMFLQRNAGKTGYSMISATILVYFFRCVFASCMFLRTGASKHAFYSLFNAAGGRFGRVPVFLLPMIPGFCLAAYDALSFASLSALDPVTYQVVLHGRLVLLVIVWQLTFRRKLSLTQWLAMGLLFCASVSKGADKLTASGDLAMYGLIFLLMQIILSVLGNVSSELLLKELPISTDLLNACMYCEGFLALMVAVHAGIPGAPRASVFSELLAAAAWERLVQDPWMIASIACLTVFGIVTAYFLKEFSNLLKELGACFVILASAILEWFLLGMSSCTLLGSQACVLAILALGVYNVHPIARDDAKK